MKTKIITALIAFAATFGTSAALTGALVGKQTPEISYTIRSSNKTPQKISKLLRQDIRNGQERLNKFSRSAQPFSATWLAAYSKAVNEYQAKSASMDDNDLPSDFQSAWRQHMQAWLDHAVFVEQLKKSAADGEMTADDIADEFADENDEINQTWERVLDLADEYDANPYDVD